VILVDTSVWIHHLRSGDRHLRKLLLAGEVACHVHIIGELACGNIKNREEIISLLLSLPASPVIDFQEFLYFIEQNHLNGQGISFVDIHLLASAQLGRLPLWTEDKRLKTAAEHLDMSYKKK